MAAQPDAFGNEGKKAVHVKWAGKTIALGTFPASEADEKCARAKALTRAWRSTMRPKPSREWVMLELERLGVRVVSGRLGRKSGEEGEDAVGGGSEVVQKPADVQVSVQGGPSRNNSLGWGGDADFGSLIGSRRNSSMGFSMMSDNRRGSLSSLGHVMGLDGTDPPLPSHRSMTGGFDEELIAKGTDQQRRASSLGLGSLSGDNMGMPVHPNQHYEMLKLHHMNLLNEIQQTTLMMNLYQQQQLRQHQLQQFQHQHQDPMIGDSMGGTDAHMTRLLQSQNTWPGSGGTGSGNGLDPMFRDVHLQHQRDSLGLGGPQLDSSNFRSQGRMSMMQQQFGADPSHLMQSDQLGNPRTDYSGGMSRPDSLLPDGGLGNAILKAAHQSPLNNAPPKNEANTGIKEDPGASTNVEKKRAAETSHVAVSKKKKADDQKNESKTSSKATQGASSAKMKEPNAKKPSDEKKSESVKKE